ncbi:MAG: response regulator transcription factor [Oscillospiraceae bacterium]|nr:response regulator transcription factor [Oscillospiraceae bacterium]
MQKVWVVEDEDSIRDMVIYALGTAGFETAGFESGEGLFPRLKEEIPALLMLDIMLPGEDGLSILRRLKQSQAWRRLPVILLTAKGAEMDRIKGLDMGADDYVTKPFSVMELISRVKTVLRRCETAESPAALKVGAVALYPEKRAVTAGEDEVTLTFKEFELLRALMASEGVVLTRDRLLDTVWGFDYSGESRTVDMHIKSLRQKLGDYGKLIRTVRNVGYKMGE